MELDFPISAHSPIAREVFNRGFTRFLLLAEHLRALPYGRPRRRLDILAVLDERTGTCSSKHHLLAALAHECGRTDIELIVGIYEMSERNTPGVGALLDSADIGSIPEAHCYLRLGGRRHDFTGLSSGESSPFDALRSEHVVAPTDLIEEKARLHRGAMQAWAAGRAWTFADAWTLREQCIAALADKELRQNAALDG